MRYSQILFVLLIILAIIGCRSSRDIIVIPVPTDPNYIFAVGIADSRDMSLAMTKAESDGRLRIAQELGLRFSGLLKRFQEEVGLSDGSVLLDQFTTAYKIVIDQELFGTRTVKYEIQEDGPIYRAQTLMQMPIGEANLALMEQVNRYEELYTRFRASEAFEELNREIEEYRELRESEGRFR